MLKISILDDSTQHQLVLEGKLIQPWVTELRKVWERAAADLDHRKLVIELRNLTAISKEGEDLLRELIEAGAKFHCCGVFTNYVLKQLAREAQQSFEEIKR